jgi:hypothetical protein
LQVYKSAALLLFLQFGTSMLFRVIFSCYQVLEIAVPAVAELAKLRSYDFSLIPIVLVEVLNHAMSFH